MKLAVAAIFLVIRCAAQTAPQSATVPLTLDHNRIVIDVYLPLPDGNQRIRGWVDNGDADLWVSERVAKLMALKPAVNAKENEGLGDRVHLAQAPVEVVIGGMKIAFAGIKDVKVMDADSIAPGVSAEINLPSTVLRNYDLVIDYPDRKLTIAAPGQAKFTGKPARAFVNPANGLVQLPAKIDGQPYQLALDFGSCFSMLTGDALQKLAQDYPKWPRNTGAVGAELFWGMDREAKMQMLRIPSMQYGPLTLAQVGFDPLPQEFMTFYRQRAGTETSGLVGGDALLRYRVGIDYAHAIAYFEERSNHIASGIDVVGLTIRPELDGRYTVIGVPEYEAKPSVPEVRAGDVLIAIDKVPAKGKTMGEVWSLLGGKPGETRALTVEREARQFTVNATVRRFLPTSTNSK